jgi:hypothetical protein
MHQLCVRSALLLMVPLGLWAQPQSRNPDAGKGGQATACTVLSPCFADNVFLLADHQFFGSGAGGEGVSGVKECEVQAIYPQR